MAGSGAGGGGFVSNAERMTPSSFWGTAVRVILIVTSAFAVYANATTRLAPEYNRMVHWGLIGTAALLAYRRPGQTRPRAIDILLSALLAASTAFVVWDYRAYIERTGLVTTAELVFGLVMIALVLEATRRTVGSFLAVMVVVFIGYALGGQHLGGPFTHRGYDLDRLVGSLYLGASGIYGLPMEISATFVIMFVIFGAVLTYTGGDRWFMDLSLRLTGRVRGGPGLSAIVSSALMGLISGSPVANVVTTGNLTIPLMRRVGFQPHFAGATVAVASTGAMFMPPLMGAGAFLIAEFIQTAYSEVARAAILPAVLFYVSLVAVVYLRSRQLGISVVDEELPRMWDTVRQYGHMIPPVVVLVALVFSGRSLMQAAFWSIVLTLVCAALRAHTRITVPKLIGALEESGKGVLAIAVACAAAGVIVGVINLTGLGFSLSAVLTGMAEGRPLLLAGVVMLAALMLGMAIPPTAVYIVLAGLSVPAMTSAGFEPMASHFFIFFYSAMGAITPPVALAAYAAAALSGSDVSRTGFAAFRLGIAGYLVPFLTLYYPGLLLVGDTPAIVTAFGISLVAVLAAAVGMHFINQLWHDRLQPKTSPTAS